MSLQLRRVRQEFRGVRWEGPKGIVTIPSGATLRVPAQYGGAHTIVNWEGQQLLVFTVDLEARSTSVDEPHEPLANRAGAENSPSLDGH